MYREVLSVKDNRGLEILEYLFENDTLTLTQLAEQSDFTKKTIHAEIARLNALDTLIKIEPRSNLGYQLSIPDNCSKDYLYKIVLDNSLEIEILSRIFLSDNTVTINDLSNQLYVSSSTIRRVITRLNAVLGRFNFQIEGKKLQLVGDEINIHNLFYALYSEKHSFEMAFFSEIKMENIEQLTEEVIVFLSIQSDVEVRQIVKLHIMLNFQRYCYGELHKMVPTYSLREFKSNYQKKLEHLFQVNLADFFENYLLHPFSSQTFFMKQDDLLGKDNQELSVTKEIREITSFLTVLAEKYQLILDFEELVPRLLNSIHFIKATPYFLYNKQADFIYSLALEYPILKNIVTEAKEQLIYPEYVLEEMISKVLFFTPTIVTQLKRTKKLIKVAVFSDVHHTHAVIIKEILDTHYPYELKINVIREESIEALKQEVAQYDLLLTTKSNLPIDIPIICVNPFPQISDYEKINHYINKWNEQLAY